MGCGASVVNQVEGAKKDLGKKIDNLEEEMRDIQLKIKEEEKIVHRLKVQNRVQEAAQHLNHIKTLQERLNRTRRRISQTDRNRETLDKKMDLKEDVDDLKETEKVSNKIQINYSEALKTHDNLRKIEDQIDTYSDLIHSDDNESEILESVTKDISAKQVISTKAQKKDKSHEGYQIMQLIVDNMRSQKWREVNKYADQCISLNYDLWRTYWIKAKAQMKLEAYADAIVSINSSFEQIEKTSISIQNIKKSKMYYMRGMAFLHEEKSTDAKHDFERSLQENKRNWNAHFELGKILQSENNMQEKALECFRKAYGFSNYECTEANVLMKKLKGKNNSNLKVIKTKGEEMKKENATLNNVKVLHKNEIEQYNYHNVNAQKYVIQSMEMTQRVLTVNLQYKEGDSGFRNEIVLYNRVGNSINQLWTFENGYIISCQNKKYLSYNEDDKYLYLTGKPLQKFTFQNKFILLTNDIDMCIDIKEENNPYNILMEIDDVGAGQRDSQYWKFMPVQIMSNLRKERQRIFVEGQNMNIKTIPIKKAQMGTPAPIANTNVNNYNNAIVVPKVVPNFTYVDVLGLSNGGKFTEIDNVLKRNTKKPFPGINRFNIENGNTALFNAIAMNKTETTRLLLLNGANPNQPNIFGATPLHVCVSWMRPQIILILRSAGANPLLVDFNGMNVFHYVKKMRRPQWYNGLLTQNL